MKESNIKAFIKRFQEYVDEHIHPDQLVPVVEIDTEIELQEIDDKFVRVLNQFRPFGPENNAPVFLTENVVDNGYGKKVGGGGEHLKLNLVQESDPYHVFPAIAFQQGKKFEKMNGGTAFDICYSVEENEFKGHVNTQLNIRDIKFD